MVGRLTTHRSSNLVNALIASLTEFRQSKESMWKVLLKEPYTLTLYKKRSFQLRISSLNVTKSAVSCGFGQNYWRNPWWKTSFFVQCESWSLASVFLQSSGKMSQKFLANKRSYFSAVIYRLSVMSFNWKVMLEVVISIIHFKYFVHNIGGKSNFYLQTFL